MKAEGRNDRTNFQLAAHACMCTYARICVCVCVCVMSVFLSVRQSVFLHGCMHAWMDVHMYLSERSRR